MSAASEAQEPSFFSLFDSSWCRDAADESETFRRRSPDQPWTCEGAFLLVPAALSPGVGVQREAVMADRCRALAEDERSLSPCSCVGAPRPPLPVANAAP